MVQHYTRIIGKLAFDSLVLHTICSEFFGWTPEKEEAGVTNWDDDVLDDQARAVLKGLREGATSVQDLVSRLQVGEQLPALVGNLTDEEVIAFALFLESVESLEDPAPCILLDEESLMQELQAHPALAALELGMPSFEWNDHDKPPCQRAQDLLASMVHKISIAR